MKLWFFSTVILVLTCAGCGSGSSPSSSQSSTDSLADSSSSVDLEVGISTSVEGDGTITPEAVSVFSGDLVEFAVSPSDGFELISIEGCNGVLEGRRYIVAEAASDCRVAARFSPIALNVDVNTTGSGQAVFSEETVFYGDSLVISMAPDEGYYLESVSGCGGVRTDLTFSVAAIHSSCSVDIIFAQLPPLPEKPELRLEYAETKTLKFSWPPLASADEVMLLEKQSNQNAYTVLEELPPSAIYHNHRALLPYSVNSNYKLRVCNAAGCSESDSVTTTDDVLLLKNTWQIQTTGKSLDVVAVGANGSIAVVAEDYPEKQLHVYKKTENQWLYSQLLLDDLNNALGVSASVDISSDGKFIVVGTPCNTNSEAESNSDSNARSCSGAVRVFQKFQGEWQQSAYLSPEGVSEHNAFGLDVAVADDGRYLAALTFDPEAESYVNGRDGYAVWVYENQQGSWHETDRAYTSCPTSLESFPELAMSQDGAVIALSTSVSFDSGLDPVPEGYREALLDDGCFRGFVYIFRQTNNTWVEEQRILPEDGQLRFGHGLSLSANAEVVTSSGREPVRSYVYARKGGSWVEELRVNQGEFTAVNSPGTKTAFFCRSCLELGSRDAFLYFDRAGDEWVNVFAQQQSELEIVGNTWLDFSEDGKSFFIVNLSTIDSDEAIFVQEF